MGCTLKRRRAVIGRLVRSSCIGSRGVHQSDWVGVLPSTASLPAMSAMQFTSAHRPVCPCALWPAGSGSRKWSLTGTQHAPSDRWPSRHRSCETTGPPAVCCKQPAVNLLPFTAQGLVRCDGSERVTGARLYEPVRPVSRRRRPRASASYRYERAILDRLRQPAGRPFWTRPTP